jgi:hypothetical protein
MPERLAHSNGRALAATVHCDVERCADLTHTAVAEPSEALYEYCDRDALYRV